MRGFACIGLDNPKTPANVGSAMRAVGVYHAAFTLSPESGALSCCADLPGDWALYAISVRRLIALHSGFLQTSSHDDALAFG